MMGSNIPKVLDLYHHLPFHNEDGEQLVTFTKHGENELPMLKVLGDLNRALQTERLGPSMVTIHSQRGNGGTRLGRCAETYPLRPMLRDAADKTAIHGLALSARGLQATDIYDDRLSGLILGTLAPIARR
ncbi:hypothetical protein CFD26_101012 [Aspergillus turcosus]|uniref:Uncharacterized protein n=1 Tax=Aspergillus turcosus TaxID=1245748 RepID=A0A421CV94_9EURO|nr:hypothetical protein CFD26_101012 [Aspergillus turcosus]